MGRMVGGLADQIKERLTAREVVEFYGFHPDWRGYIHCPFHSEKTGSLKIYSGDKAGWHCFGCGAGGSVIDFVMRLFHLSFRDACVRLNTDFHLGLTDEEDPAEALARRKALQEARRREAARKAREEKNYRAVAAEYRYWHDVTKYFAPGPEDQAACFIHPLYAEAVKRLPVLEYWLDEHIGR